MAWPARRRQHPKGETGQAAKKRGMLKRVKTADEISKSNAVALKSSAAPAGVTLGVTEGEFPVLP